MSYSFADSILVYKALEHSFRGQMNFELEIRNLNSVVKKDSWSVEHVVQSSSDPLRSEILGQRAYTLKRGQYRFFLRVKDAVRPSRHDSTVVDVVVQQIAQSKPALSELMLCSKLRPLAASDSAVFMRNGYEAVPKATREYRGAAPVLHSYVELYNLHLLRADTVNMLYRILDGAGRGAIEVSSKHKIVAAAQTDVFEQELEFLPTGTYYLEAILLAQNEGVTDSILTRKKFFILNPTQEADLSDLKNEDQLFLASEFATMSDQSIDDEYKKALAVGPATELASFPQLTSLNAKQKYIFRYWYLKDPDPSTPENERYEQFKKAVRHAELNFKNMFAPKGWDCDMGRVLMKYGFPTNISKEIFNGQGAYPYEVWTYDGIQGGVEFVFVNMRGKGLFTLVHSTAYNEKHEADWYAKYATDQSKRN